MILHDAQRKIVSSTARFKVVVCGRGFGKTLVATEILGYNAVTKPVARILYISPTYQSSRDIAWSRLKNRYRDAITKANESLLELTLLNGSTIVLRGWESVDTLRGQEFDLIVIDEVDSMRRFWEGWEEVLRPTLRVSQGPVVFIGTPKGFATLYTLTNQCGQKGFEDWEAFHFTSYDNPHLPVDEIDAAKRQLPENTFAQEYLADFRKHDGLIYQEFDRKRHIIAPIPIPLDAEYMAGVDFAYSHACAVIHIYRFNNTYYIVDEFYKTKQTDLKIAEYVSSQNFHRVYPDPAQPQGIAELERFGVNCYHVDKSSDSVEKGISRIRELLKQTRIKVFNTCLNTITEFETYAEDDKGRIIKEGDDAMDAIRYAIVSMEAAQNPQHSKAIQAHLQQNFHRITNSSTR